MPNSYTLLAATDDQSTPVVDVHTDGVTATDNAVEATSHTVEEASHGAESETGAAVLGIDPLAIALQAGTFLILFVIIKKFALSKIVATLEDRRQTIEEGLKNAADIEQQKVELIKSNESEMAQARKEADVVISKSHEEAGSIVAEAQASATKQADEIVSKAKAQAVAEAENVRQELKGEMLSLVSAATENVLEEKLDDAKDKQIIERALKQSAGV